MIPYLRTENLKNHIPYLMAHTYITPYMRVPPRGRGGGGSVKFELQVDAGQKGEVNPRVDSKQLHSYQNLK